MTTGSMELAQARVAARYGARIDETVWHRIEMPRTLAGVLDAVRTTSLEPWVVGLTPDTDAHAIDRHMRAHWRASVHEVSRWMPPCWQPAVDWWATLPDVPLVAHLAAYGAPAWMRDDAHYRPLVDPRTAPRHVLGSLLARVAGGAPTATAWVDEWKRRLPPGDAGPLPQLLRALSVHLRAFRTLAPGDGTAARRALKPRLAMLFRHAITTPAAVFAYLVLMLLDAERLRGEVMRRAALPGVPLAR